MTPKIIQPPPPAQPVPAEIIATAIVQIAAAMSYINSTQLTRRAIVALIHDHSKVNKKVIDMVLNNLSALETNWLKVKPSKD